MEEDNVNKNNLYELLAKLGGLFAQAYPHYLNMMSAGKEIDRSKLLEVIYPKDAFCQTFGSLYSEEIKKRVDSLEGEVKDTSYLEKTEVDLLSKISPN